MLDDLMTVPEAAMALGISTAAIRQLIQRGRLAPVRRIGKNNLLLKADVLAYQASRAGQGKRGPQPGTPRTDQGNALAA